MPDIVGIALVLVGVVLLFAGATFSVYGVAVLGAVLGGGAGYLFAPVLGLDGLVATLAATGLGIAAGVVLAYLLLSLAVAAVGFAAGAYVGAVAVAPLFAGGSALSVAAVALGVGAVVAFLSNVLTRTAMVFVTSFVGAALASGSVTAADLGAARAAVAPDPVLFDPASPLFLFLFALGVLTQFGLFRFGYVTALVSRLPGASVLRDRTGGRDSTQAGEPSGRENS